MKNIFHILRFILICLCYTSTNPIYAQTTFNHRYHFDHPTAVLGSVHPTDSCYYATGIVRDTAAPHPIGALFAKFDLEGNTLWVRTLTKPDKYYETWRSTLIPTPDGNFIAAGYVQEGNEVRTLLIKYTPTGDTIMTREYSSPYYNSNFLVPLDIVPCENGGYGVVNNTSDPYGSGYSDFCILRVDEELNTLWIKTYPNDLLAISKSISTSQDGGFIVGGWLSDYPLVGHNYLAQAYIFKVDSLGNMGWEYKSSEEEQRFYANDILKEENDELIIISCFGWELLSPSGPFDTIGTLMWEPAIFKLNSEQEMEWETTFGNGSQSPTNDFTKLVEAPDQSGYLGIGKLHVPATDSSDIRGWITKVSPEGDSLWARYLQFMEFGRRDHTLTDIKACPDGGYILCGQARKVQNDPDAPNQQAWLLKVDANGCLVPGCHTPATEIPTQNIQLSIYPNPTSDYLNFLIRQQKRPKNASVRIINAAGQLVQQIEAVEKEVTYMLPVWHWEAGIYFLQYLENGRVRAVEKVVIH